MLYIIIFLLGLQAQSQVAPNIQQPDSTKFFSGRLQFLNLGPSGYTEFNLAFPSSFNSSEPRPQLVISLISLKFLSNLIINGKHNSYYIIRITFSSTEAQIGLNSERPQ